MSAETDLYAALSASSALASLVGTRIYPDAIPEDQALPAVVYQRAGTDKINTIHGAAIAEDVRFSITAWSKTRTTADSVAAALSAALEAAAHQSGDQSGGIDQETGLFATSIDVEWFHVF